MNKPGSMTAREKRAAGQKPIRSIEQFDIYQDDTNSRYYTWDNGFQEWIGSKHTTEQDAVDNAEFLSANEGVYRG